MLPAFELSPSRRHRREEPQGLLPGTVPAAPEPPWRLPAAPRPTSGDSPGLTQERQGQRGVCRSANPDRLWRKASLRLPPPRCRTSLLPGLPRLASGRRQAPRRHRPSPLLLSLPTAPELRGLAPREAFRRCLQADAGLLDSRGARLLCESALPARTEGRGWPPAANPRTISGFPL